MKPTKKKFKAVDLIEIAVALALVAIFIVVSIHRFKHPELTETQLFLWMIGVEHE